MTDYRELPICIKRSISNNVSSGRGKVKLRFFLKDKSERLVLTLQDIFYLPNSPCNLVNLAYLNNSRISHNNKDENLYHVKTHQVLVQAPQ